MAMLTFTCPRTGAPIDSGIETDRLTYQTVRRVALDVKCRHCGKTHDFRVEHGSLAEAA